MERPVPTSEDACFEILIWLLHPGGLACPRCGDRSRRKVHRRRRCPVLDYRCGHCGRVFNAWTGTVLEGTHRRPSEILTIMHGFARGTPTARMARELKCQRAQLVVFRRRLKAQAGRLLAFLGAGDVHGDPGQRPGHPGDHGARPERSRGPDA